MRQRIEQRMEVPPLDSIASGKRCMTEHPIQKLADTNITALAGYLFVLSGPRSQHFKHGQSKLDIATLFLRSRDQNT